MIRVKHRVLLSLLLIEWLSTHVESFAPKSRFTTIGSRLAVNSYLETLSEPVHDYHYEPFEVYEEYEPPPSLPLPPHLLSSFAYQTAMQDSRVDIRFCGPDKGFGAFAITFIPELTFLGYYTGEILTQEQVDSRYYGERAPTLWDLEWIASRKRRNQTLTGNYMFDVSLNPEFKDNLIYIDGEDLDKSSWCRFLNHASRNKGDKCNVEPYLDMSDEKDPKIWFQTSRAIYPGEELCIDYGDYYWTGNEHLIR